VLDHPSHVPPIRRVHEDAEVQLDTRIGVADHSAPIDDATLGYVGALRGRAGNTGTEPGLVRPRELNEGTGRAAGECLPVDPGRREREPVACGPGGHRAGRDGDRRVEVGQSSAHHGAVPGRMAKFASADTFSIAMTRSCGWSASFEPPVRTVAAPSVPAWARA